MNYTIKSNNVKSIRPGDEDFLITNDITITPRAGFEISQSCPVEYRSIMITAINAGWIKPVANVSERELIFIGLNR